MVGELVPSAQAMLGQIVQDLPEDIAGRLIQTLDEVVHHTRELKDSVMSMRAQPVGAVFQRMPRLVRELATKTSKKVRLEMAGENTEVDRSIVEQLTDPLTHIIRNSVDHGIETPDVRAAASSKSEEGTIRLAAEGIRGGRIVIEIKDDGAGINPERVLKKARERGLVSADATLTDDEITNLIFLPGLPRARRSCLRHFGPRRRHGRRAPQHSGHRRPDIAQIRARSRYDNTACFAADAGGDGRHGHQGRPGNLRRADVGDGGMPAASAVRHSRSGRYAGRCFASA